jgi:hypothetical protein
MGYVNKTLANLLTLPASGAAVQSSSIGKGDNPRASVQVVVPASATSAGTFAIVGSDDGVNYSAVPGASGAITNTGAVQTLRFDILASCMWLQVQYTPSSGPGTDQATISFTLPSPGAG